MEKINVSTIYIICSKSDNIKGCRVLCALRVPGTFNTKINKVSFCCYLTETCTWPLLFWKWTTFRLPYPYTGESIVSLERLLSECLEGHFYLLASTMDKFVEHFDCYGTTIYEKDRVWFHYENQFLFHTLFVWFICLDNLSRWPFRPIHVIMNINEMECCFVAKLIDIYVWYSVLCDVSSRFTTLTGRHVLPFIVLS